MWSQATSALGIRSVRGTSDSLAAVGPGRTRGAGGRLPGVTTEQADLLDLSRYAYGRLRERLAGLSEAEYRWEPGPGVSTLAWRIGHLADLLTQERNATWLGVAGRPAPGRVPITARDALETLDSAIAVWLDVLAALPVESLGAPIGSVGGAYGGDTRRAFVLHVLDELIHHGAEVALLRDLWAARS
jgi:uncharacterized damage-inducible protein DinB